MKTALAVAACGPRLELALATGHGATGIVALAGPTPRSELVIAAVDLLLRAAGLERSGLEGIAASRGPGSFTGVRVALATAQGLAMALGVPAHGFPSLLAQASRCGASECLAVQPARRGFAYAQRFVRRDGRIEAAEEPGIVPLAALVGSAAPVIAPAGFELPPGTPGRVSRDDDRRGAPRAARGRGKPRPLDTDPPVPRAGAGHAARQEPGVMSALQQGFLTRQARTEAFRPSPLSRRRSSPTPGRSTSTSRRLANPYAFSAWRSARTATSPGTFSACWQLDELHILKVATHPLHEGKGLATTLMDEAKSEGLRSGARTLILEVRPSNRRAFRLYRHLGYDVLGRRPRYYANGEDALVMCLGARGAAERVSARGPLSGQGRG